MFFSKAAKGQKWILRRNCVILPLRQSSLWNSRWGMAQRTQWSTQRCCPHSHIHSIHLETALFYLKQQFAGETQQIKQHLWWWGGGVVKEWSMSCVSIMPLVSPLYQSTAESLKDIPTLMKFSSCILWSPLSPLLSLWLIPLPPQMPFDRSSSSGGLFISSTFQHLLSFVSALIYLDWELGVKWAGLRLFLHRGKDGSSQYNADHLLWIFFTPPYFGFSPLQVLGF